MSLSWNWWIRKHSFELMLFWLCFHFSWWKSFTPLWLLLGKHQKSKHSAVKLALEWSEYLTFAHFRRWEKVEDIWESGYFWNKMSKFWSNLRTFPWDAINLLREHLRLAFSSTLCFTHTPFLSIADHLSFFTQYVSLGLHLLTFTFFLLYFFCFSLNR